MAGQWSLVSTAGFRLLVKGSAAVRFLRTKPHEILRPNPRHAEHRKIQTPMPKGFSATPSEFSRALRSLSY